MQNNMYKFTFNGETDFCMLESNELNVWKHIALSYGYLETYGKYLFTLNTNGYVDTRFINTQINKQNTSNLIIGKYNNINGFTGYITNFRFIKGQSLYLSLNGYNISFTPFNIITGTNVLLYPTMNNPLLDLTNKNTIISNDTQWDTNNPFGI